MDKKILPHIYKCLFVCCLLFASKELFSQKAKQPLFRFGVVADVQYANRDNHGTRHYLSSIKKLEEAIAVFNKEKIDFVISLGDFINDTYKNFDTLNGITDKLKMPLHHVIGNHDYDVKDAEKQKVLKALNLKNDYYTFKKKNWKFLALNGIDISLIGNTEGSAQYKEAQQMFDKLKAEGAANAKPWNGTLSRVQINWMKNELNKAKKKKQNVIVLCHFPLYPYGSPHTLWNTSEIRNIIEAHPNVKGYLNGHVHVSQYFLKDGLHYVTFKGMVEKDDNAFAIISVFKDHLEIKGYGKEVDRILK